MGQIASIYARKPETKNEKSSSRIRKTGLSQPVKSPVDRILFLQRTIGNQAVQRLIKSWALQAKLTVNPPGDIYEQEADRIARQVVSHINQSTNQSQHVQRQEIPKEEEEEKLMKKDMVQRNEANGGWTAAPELETSIQQARGGGQPLPENMREPMETAFVADFSGVRVHTDTHSDMLNNSLQARAFTMGKDIFFKQGEYNPGSSTGQELIAHELTHVVQQNGLGREHLAEKGEKITNLQRRILQSKIDTISAKSLAAGNVIQLAYTAKRKLGGIIPILGPLYHAHIFFEDNQNPPNIGFMGPSGLGQDSSTDYTKDQTGLNDKDMRKAVNMNISPGLYNPFTNNCQHWVEKVLATYDKIK